LSSVLRLSLDQSSSQATVDVLPALPTGRSAAAVAQLSVGHVLVAGGLGANGVALDDGFLLDLSLATLAWKSVGNRMSAARVGASAVRLEDDSVLLWGGGPDTGDVFSLVASDAGGFLKLAVADGFTGLHQATAVRVDRAVLFVGGESGVEAPFCARFEPSVQTPALGQLYGGTWTPAGATTETRHGTALLPLATGGVLAIGGGAQRVELFTP
jgi:hypothetical protein